MKFVPHNYQAMCIDKVVHQNAVGLFLDMGLGKTIITLSAIEELKDRLDVSRVLIIAPKKVAETTWTTESKKWDHTKDFKIMKVMGSQMERLRALQTAADIYVINRDNVMEMTGSLIWLW